MAGPSASDNFARQSLVEEIRGEQAVAHAKEQANARRRARNRVVAYIVLGFGAVGLLFAAKRMFDATRLHNGLTQTEQALLAGSQAELDSAVERLDTNLSIDAGHAPTLGRIALVRAHQFIRGWVGRDAFERAVSAADDSSQGRVAAAILAAYDGDFDAARRVYESIRDSPDTVLEGQAAWLHGAVALAHPYDDDLEQQALARLNDTNAARPSVPGLRTVARLHARRGGLDEALELTNRARELSANDIGVSIDEALYKARKREQVGRVIAFADQLEREQDVAGGDLGRGKLAKGLALLHQGKLDQAGEALDAAWTMLSAVDNDARADALEALLSYGRVEQVVAMRRGVQLGSQADAVFDAWTELARGETSKALEQLSELPQHAPRVGHLQALALVEEWRLQEAQRWVTFAKARLPERPDLQVAQARVDLVAGKDPTEVVRTLEELSEARPYTYRVWTGLAQAHLAAAARAKLGKQGKAKQVDRIEQQAREALEQAIKREPAPAEAAMWLAQQDAAKIFDEPQAARVALKNYRLAAETPPRAARRRAAYGAFLGQLARAREAEHVLRELVDEEALGPAPLLELARVVSSDALLSGAPVDDDVPRWLARAAERNAEPNALALEWARYERALRSPEALTRARTRLETLIAATPHNVDAQALYGSVLLAQNQPGTAKLALREGIRQTARSVDGRLYVGLARAELAGGKKRRAASVGYKGWRKMVRERIPVGLLLDTAPFIAELWTDLGQPKAAATIGRGLTVRAPASPRAWVLRGKIELEDDRAADACVSADTALELDDKLAAAWGLRGACLAASGSRDKAVKALDKAVELAEGTVAHTDFVAQRKRLTRRRKR